MGAAGGRPFQRMSPTAPSGPALETTPAGTRGLAGVVMLKPYRVDHGIQSGCRRARAHDLGKRRRGPGGPVGPHGIEHAYRDGDSVSMCGEKLSRL